MSHPGYNNNPWDKVDRQVVGIIGVDPIAGVASGLNKFHTLVRINLAHQVGGLHITPALNEQWFIERVQGSWVLLNKLNWNTPETLTPPGVGQTQVSAQSILHLNAGSYVSVNAPLGTQAAATRPDPTTVPAGTQIYDTTLKKPLWSDGTAWHDATGTAV